MTEWYYFFATAAGCATTLIGLLFVGISISLKLVLSHAQLPNRALESITLLLTIVLVAGATLLPGQSAVTLGAEVLGLGLAAWAGASWLNWSSWPLIPAPHRRSHWVNIALTQLALLPCLGAGILLLASHLAGVYWLPLAIALSLGKALMDAWLLLIKVNR